jgi:hypothetical protein
MMRTRFSMFSTGKLRCKFAETGFAGLVPGRYFTNHLKTFIPKAVTRVRRNQRSSSYFLSKMKEHRFSRPFTSFGALNFPDETILHKAIFLTWGYV